MTPIFKISFNLPGRHFAWWYTVLDGSLRACIWFFSTTARWLLEEISSGRSGLYRIGVRVTVMALPSQ
jgi:hypothetical protein